MLPGNSYQPRHTGISGTDLLSVLHHTCYSLYWAILEYHYCVPIAEQESLRQFIHLMQHSNRSFGVLRIAEMFKLDVRAGQAGLHARP